MAAPTLIYPPEARVERGFPRAWTCREDVPRYGADDAARLGDASARAEDATRGALSSTSTEPPRAEDSTRGAVSTPPIASPSTQPAVHTLASGKLVASLTAATLSTRRAEARFVRSQARMLAWLSERGRVQRCGFSSIGSLALETLGLRPRTTRSRLALHRVLSKHPELERAFLDGGISACQLPYIARLIEAIPVPDELIRFSSRGSARSLWTSSATGRDPKSVPAERDERPRAGRDCPEAG